MFSDLHFHFPLCFFRSESFSARKAASVSVCYWLKAGNSSQTSEEWKQKHAPTAFLQLLCPFGILFNTFHLTIEKRGSALLPSAIRRVIYSKELVKILIGASGCKSHSEAPLSSTETSVISPPPSAFQEVASTTFCAFSSVSCHMKANSEAPLSAAPASITARGKV